MDEEQNETVIDYSMVKPIRESFEDDRKYAKAWIEYYGTSANRTVEQWKRIVNTYGLAQVARMEETTQAKIKEWAEIETMKDRTNRLRGVN